MMNPQVNKRHARLRAGFVSAWLVMGGVGLAACGSEASSSADTNGEAASSDTESTAESSSADGLENLDDDTREELEEARGELEELLESGTLGSGSGVITVDGTSYPFDAQLCFYEDTYFEAAGGGTTADGTAYWASISYSTQFRDEMGEMGFAVEALDLMFGDRDSIDGVYVSVELGKDGQFGSGDDAMANFAVDVLDVALAPDLSFSVEGKTMSGSGSILDENGVALAFGETHPLVFEATCE